MPQYGPPAAITAGGITVDGQGFVTIPNEPDAIPFKVTKEELVDGPPHRYVISVNDGGVKEVWRNEI